MAVVRSVAEVFLLVVSAFTVSMAAESTCPFPCTCTDAHGELTVSCGGQGLTEIPANIPPSVTFLNLQYNNITRVTNNSFSGLQNLQGVNLANNNISHISNMAFKHIEQLESVDISGNKLSTLSEEVFTVSVASARQDLRRFNVYMANNPWNCDCNLKWLAAELKSDSHYFSDRLLTCSQPNNLRGKELKDVPIVLLRCPSELHSFFVEAVMEQLSTMTPSPSSRPLLREPDKNRSDKMSFNIALGTVAGAIVVVVVVVKIHDLCRKRFKRRRQPMMDDLETLV